MTPITDDSPQKKMLGQKATPPPSPLLSELLKKGSLLPTSPRLVWRLLWVFESCGDLVLGRECLGPKIRLGGKKASNQKKKKERKEGRKEKNERKKKNREKMS
jgi:hypothetical protein